MEAKQTAQRLSAENFKLREDLSRERHYNELERKNMLREMEQHLGKRTTREDRADAKMEVMDQEIVHRAQDIVRNLPGPLDQAKMLRGAFALDVSYVLINLMKPCDITTPSYSHNLLFLMFLIDTCIGTMHYNIPNVAHHFFHLSSYSPFLPLLLLPLLSLCFPSLHPPHSFLSCSTA